MENGRRLILKAGAAAAALGVSNGLLHAATPWPQKTVKFLIPTPPGGAVDVVTRTLATGLSTAWNGSANAFVENKPGGNTVIATTSLFNESRDGHTFLVTFNLTRQLRNLGLKVAFDPMKDLLPVGAISVEQMMLVASSRLGAKDFAGMVEAVRKNPNGANFGTFGVGGHAHMAALQMANILKLNLTPVHYRGVAPGIQAIITGEIDIFLANIGAAQQYAATGQLVPIAVMGPQRNRFVPQLPTLSEVGIPGLEFINWIGLFAAKSTPADIVGKLSTDMRAALQTQEVISKFNAFYLDPGRLSLEEFGALVKDDDEKMAKLILQHGVRLE